MELLIFFITAAIALFGGIAMLTSRNAVHSAIFLLLNFAALAVLFLLLNAPFLFALQLTIYAGAIMVLFLFVVMLLGAEKAEDEKDTLEWQRPIASGLGLLLFIEIVGINWASLSQANSTNPALETFGDPVKMSEVLFTTYLLPFEITSIILLVAIIGVVVLNQRGKVRP